LNDGRVLRVPEGGEVKQRVDGSQAGVARGHGITAFGLEGVQEGADEWSIQVPQTKLNGRSAKLGTGEAQQ
jgi:hypothetical protein